MANPIFKLEEQLPDLRSNQVVYKLTIENPDTKAIRLLTINPRVPNDVALLEVTDSLWAEANARRTKLLKGLNILLKHYLWVESSQFRQAVIEGKKEAAKKIFNFKRFMSFYLKYVFQEKNFQEQMKQDFDIFIFDIDSASDARAAHDRWMKNSDKDEVIRPLFEERWMKNLDKDKVIKPLFEEKMTQLECIEKQLIANDESTTIEAGSFFTATYVLKFARQILEPKKYLVSFVVIYDRPPDGGKQNGSAGISVQISPYPFSLSIVAILAALLGVLLKVSLSDKPDPLQEMHIYSESGKILVGPILALIFFNAYEYTSLGKNINMTVSWRSALLIGALCGLAQDRVLAALKALIGA